MAEENNNIEPQIEQVRYDDENIRHLSDMEHVRTRPGMYIGRLGDGSLPEDGIRTCVSAFATTDEASLRVS